MTEIPVIYYNGTDPRKSFTNSWWTCKDDETIGQHAWAVIDGIRKNQSYRRENFVRYARLYSNNDFDRYIAGVSAGYFGRKLTFNISRSCVDTACAKISKSRPRPLFLTSKGNYTQQTRAKNLTKYIDGVFYQGNIHKIGKKVFRDACIFGTGLMKIFERNGQVVYERTFPLEIVVDDIDGREQAPRSMHQVKLVQREVLLDLYKDDTKALRFIKTVGAVKMNGETAYADMIEVSESWHLKSSPDAKDGKHVIAIKNHTLESEEWKHDFFPFVSCRWNESILGFFGEGLVAQLVGIQLEINTILLRIKEAQELAAVPRLMIEEGSGVSDAQITDEIGSLIRYRGTKPEPLTWTAMGGEIYTYLEYLYQKGFQDTGISQLSASSKKPAGLNSGIAIREYQDIETERFALVAEAYQDMYMEAAKISIAIERELYEEDKKLAVNVKGKGFIETVKWKDVDLADDQFVMQAYPTNLLPKTPEGRLQYTQELIQSGFIDPSEGLSLLDFPDIEGFMSLRTAAYDDVKYIIEKMVEDEEYTPPEPYMDLRLSLKMVNSAYLRAKTDGTGEASMELMLRFIDECSEILSGIEIGALQQQAAAVAPAPGAAPAQPGKVAKAAPAPVSDLIPMTQ